MNQYDPTSTSLDSEPLAITDDDRAKVMWLLRRYTSVTYIARMTRLVAWFAEGYKDFARRATSDVAFHRENLANFYSYSAALTKGVDLVSQGYPTGYGHILEGSAFGRFLGSPRFDSGYVNEDIGFRPFAPPEGLYAWAHVAIRMSDCVRTTLEGTWAYPFVLDARFLTSPFPEELPPEPPTGTLVIATDHKVPISGIWRPVGVVSGCANYLRIGAEAPPARRARQRLDYPAYPTDGGGVHAAHTEYVYKDEPAQWELVWEDHRYDSSQAPRPEEEAYLDASTELPAWPPEALRPVS